MGQSKIPEEKGDSTEEKQDVSTHDIEGDFEKWRDMLI